jgi:hypothetical protein
VSFCLVLAACGGGDADDADPQPTTTSPSTTQSPDEADEQALRQLAEDWYGFIGNAYANEADLDALSEYLVDPYLTQFRDQISDHQAAGNTTDRSSQSSHDVESLSIDGERAEVIECVVDADVLLGPQGEILNDEVNAQRVTTTAIRTADGWRFTERDLTGEWEGETQCGV